MDETVSFGGLLTGRYRLDHSGNAGKKAKGRKRHIATDALGLLLVLIVTASSDQDSVGGKQVLDHLAGAHSDVSMAWVDGGYNNMVIQHGAQRGSRSKL